jgi:hypothetical protein
MSKYRIALGQNQSLWEKVGPVSSPERPTMTATGRALAQTVYTAADDRGAGAIEHTFGPSRQRPKGLRSVF